MAKTQHNSASRSGRAVTRLGRAPSAKSGMSAAAMAWLSGMGGETTSQLNEPLKPYESVIWVYRCVRKIAEAAAGIPVRLMRQGVGATVLARSYAAAIRPTSRRTLRPVMGRKAVCTGRAIDEEIVESGDAWRLLQAPNSYRDWPMFMHDHAGFLLTRGKVAWLLTGLAGRRPEEMHAIDGRRIEPKWRRTPEGLPLLAGYAWTPPERAAPLPLAPDEARYFNIWSDSDDPLAGLSPLRPGRLSVATDYNASLYNASQLVNAAEPGLVIKPGTLSQEQRDQLKAALLERYQGPAKAKRPLILENGEVEQLGTSMADLQFMEGKRTTRLEICCLYGVPPVVAGWVDAAGDSSAYTANALRQFYQETVFPFLDAIAPSLQEIVSRFDPGLLAWFDVEDSPIVQEMRLARMDAAKKYFDLGYPMNAVNRLLDLGMSDYPWHETGYFGSNLLPAADVASGGGFPATPEGPAPGQNPDDLGQPSEPGKAAGSRAGANVEPAGVRGRDCPAPDPADLAERDARGRIWQAWARAWAPLAQQFRQVLRSRYFALEKAALAALKKQTDWGRDSGTGIRTKALDPGALVAEIFADPKARDAFRVRVRTALKDGQELGLRQALSESGLKGDELEAALKKLLSDPRLIDGLKAETIIVSTKIDDKTRTLLKANLEEGLNAGESYKQLGSRIEAYFGHRRGQAILVARNTVGQVLSASRHEGYVSCGMTHKLWLHSRAPMSAPRENHVEAEERYASEPCPIDQPFVIHGEKGDVELMFPRDAAGGRGHPEEIVNCQCLQLGRRFGDERREQGTGNREQDFVTHGQMLAARAARAADRREHGENDGG